LKPGELVLKGDNRKGFERALGRNLKAMLGGGPFLEIRNGRYLLRGGEGRRAAVESALDRLIGISGWAETAVMDKNLEAILPACIAEGRRFLRAGIGRFKVEARRTDKGFPLDSYALCCRVGDAVTEALPELKVDVRKPEAVIRVEIRERAFVYGDSRRGLGGLPVGTAGRGMLLLSGGIDSPVAGFLMATRGMAVDAVHFHTPPYTSEAAKEKVVRLAGVLASYCIGIRLHLVDFTAMQMKLREGVPENWSTVILRMAMMDCAGRIARRTGSGCLVTGESLSQVASQTLENLACTESPVSIPVLRPLIGTDKEAIVRKAEEIGSYRISVEPFPDCCVLFSPERPILRGRPERALALYRSLEPEELIERAIARAEVRDIGQ